MTVKEYLLYIVNETLPVYGKFKLCFYFVVSNVRKI